MSGVDRSPSERADVCVVGTGPAGALLAHSLAVRGRDVVMLEAGERFDRDERLERMKRGLRPEHSVRRVWDMGGERDAYTAAGDVEYDLNDHRVKGVGGTTLHWGGIVPRLHEKDFEMNSRYGLASDWPIDYEDLRPYYAEAERRMGVAGTDDNPFGPPREEAYPMEGFDRSYPDQLLTEACEELGIDVHTLPSARNSEPYDDRATCEGWGTCIPVCPSGAKYDASYTVDEAEHEGARVIDRAPVQRLVHDDDGETVEAAVYATPDGEYHRQEAREFVLACGAIETPRLLLLSASEQYPDGLANSSGLVGRNLMEHLSVLVYAEIDEETRQRHVGFNTTTTQQFYDHEEASPGSFQIDFSNFGGPRPIELALGDGEWGDELVDRVDETYGNSVVTFGLVEQLPYEENRVTLDHSTTDDHGNPVPKIEWTLHSHELETAERALEVQSDIVSQLDPTFVFEADPENPDFPSHPAGTTRMGTDPVESVVTPECRTHDLDNLSIASSSVFVTNGATNPTLTIAALALKTADHVHERL
jgi:choline dehydrogenase-like flavoprotein